MSQCCRPSVSQLGCAWHYQPPKAQRLVLYHHNHYNITDIARIWLCRVTVEECWMYSMMLSLSDRSSSGGLDNNSSPEDSPTLYSDSILQNIPSTHYRLKHSGLDSVDCNYDNLEKFVFKVPSFRGLGQHVMSHIVYKDWWLKSSTQQSHTFRVINHNQWTIKLGHSLTALYYWSRSNWPNLSQHFMKCSKSLEKYQQGCKVFNFIKLKTLVLM